MNEIVIKPSRELAYFVGVLHSDGCIYTWNDKKHHRKVNVLLINVGKLSLPMLFKVQKIFKQVFKRDIKILNHKYDTLVFDAKINRLMPFFKELEIIKNGIPEWIKSNKIFFCSYLAGLIDGDGNVKITKPRYKQCRVTIISGDKLNLKRLIMKYLKCKMWIEQINKPSTLPSGKKILPNAKRYCFCVSSKNMSTFRKHVYSEMQILHKRRTIENYFEICPRRDLNPQPSP